MAQEPKGREQGRREDLSKEDQEHYRRIEQARRARMVKAGVVAAIVVILVLFVLWNAHSVDVSLVFATIQAPLIWVIIVPVILGGLAGYLIGRPTRKRLHDHDRKG